MITGKLVIGIDYGTDSVRALVVNTETGKEETNSGFNVRYHCSENLSGVGGSCCFWVKGYY